MAILSFTGGVRIVDEHKHKQTSCPQRIKIIEGKMLPIPLRPPPRKREIWVYVPGAVFLEKKQFSMFFNSTLVMSTK